MFSVHSKQNNRKNNGTHNDGVGSVVDESSPPYQTRKHDSGSHDDEYVTNIISNGRNLNSRDLIKPDFENNGGVASNQDCSSIVRDTKLKHVSENEEDDEDVVREGSDDGNLYWRVEQEIKERDSNDVLIDSLDELRISAEALQLEIDKFWLIGNGSFLPDGDDSASSRSEDAEANVVDLRFHDSCSCNHSGKQISSSSVEHQVVSLTEKIKKLESKLEELQGVIAIKNSRIAELETAFTGEIDKFLLIGNGSFLPDGDDSASYRSEDAEANAVDLRFHDSCSCNSSGKQISSSSVEHQVVSLTEKIKKLESKLEELQGVIAIKNSRIAELETTFTGGEFAEEESACNIGFLDEKFKELKSELERFFQQKIETEIKYLTIKKMMQNLKVASALAEKQKPMSGSEVQIPKLEEAGNEDPIMKNITDEELVHQVMRIRRLKKLAFGILIIFLCLILVLQVIVWELMPNSEVVVVVPT